MAKKNQYYCRFAVGDPLGLRSGTWAIRANQVSSDIYIMARGVGGSMKATLHASGKRHVRHTKWFPNQPKEEETWKQGLSPFALEWEGGLSVGPGIIVEFDVKFPHEELTVVPEIAGNTNPKKPITWIPAPPPEHEVHVCVFLGPPAPEGHWPGKEGMEMSLIGRCLLRNGQMMWVTWCVTETILMKNTKSEKENFRSLLLSKGRDPSTITKADRIVIPYEADNGIYGFIEWSALKALT